MQPSARSRRRLRELVGTNLTAHELNRLARVDALLRDTAVRPSLTLAAEGPPATPGPRRHGAGEQTQVLRLTFGELALVYKSLQAAKTLGVAPSQDELLDDTIQVVDQALDEARSEAAG